LANQLCCEIVCDTGGRELSIILFSTLDPSNYVLVDGLRSPASTLVYVPAQVDPEMNLAQSCRNLIKAVTISEDSS
jgi:hypothetical protein